MLTTSKWRLLASAATALACLIAAGSSGATTGWVNTHTQAIPLQQARLQGPVNPAQKMHITLALQMQNMQQLQDLVRAQSTPGTAQYGTVITPAQFNATYAPTDASVAAVTSYLSGAGFTNIQVEPNHLFISAHGTAAQVSAAFNTSLSNFKQKGKSIYVNTAPAQVPTALGGIVLSVLGLNNVKMNLPMSTPCDISTPTCLRFSYDPAQFQKAYNVGSVGPARNVSIAIMAEGDVTPTVHELHTFEQAMGLPFVNVTVVQVGLWSPDTAGVIEWNMDSQYTTGMAGTVKNLYIYATTSLTDQDVALEFNKWATQNVAQVANASFGICEVFPFLDGSMVADDQVLLEAAAQGQTMFASTGDTGSFCTVAPTNGVPAGAPLVEYPAASPYVVGVGGTTLLTNADGSYQSEVAWYAGGGGISQFEYSPWWQSPVIPTNNPDVPVTFRAIPDVSMDADPNTGAIVYYNGQVNYVGGTSLSSPLAAGAYARLLNSSQMTLGFAGPKFYGKYPAFGTPPGANVGLTAQVDGFRDVLTGGNVLFTSLPYYDFTTGLGTVDVAAKRKALK